MHTTTPRRLNLPPIRITREERAEIRRLARAANLTVAEHVRRRALSPHPAVEGEKADAR